MKVLNQLFAFLASFGLAIAILVFMLIATFLGTIVQETVMSLPEAQRQYFDSWVILQRLDVVLAHFGFDVPIYQHGAPSQGDLGWSSSVRIPLPGGLLLMALLSLNLVCGGIVRMKKTLSRAGILIAHLGIAFLMLAGLVNEISADEGLLALYEGQRSAEYRDINRLEIAIMKRLEEGKVEEFTVSAEGLRSLRPGRRLTVAHPSLPFELDLHDFMVNSVLVHARGSRTALPVIDGYRLQPVRPVVELDRQDRSGCYATARIPGAPDQVGILWQYDGEPMFVSDPWTVRVGEEQYGVKLRLERREIPFEVQVEDFVADFFPGTRMPREYRSDVTVFDGDAETKHRIEMNEPLRLHGYVLFQSSWGPQNAGSDDELYTVFAVVQNVSDQWPAWACLVIGIGLTMHFGVMFFEYARRERNARVAREQEAAA